MPNFQIAIIGLGIVGQAMYESFCFKGFQLDSDLFIYDKYKNLGIGSLKNCIQSDIAFLALPTVYNYKLGEYDKTAIDEVCQELENCDYHGVVVIKSTIEPETTDKL